MNRSCWRKWGTVVWPDLHIFFKKKTWRSAGSHDQQTRVRVEKFNKTLANAQLMPDAYKHLTRPPTNSKWWQLSQGLKSKSMMLQQATSTKGTLTVFFFNFQKEFLPALLENLGCNPLSFFCTLTKRKIWPERNSSKQVPSSKVVRFYILIPDDRSTT